MRRRPGNQQVSSEALGWSSARLLATLIAGAVVAVALVAGLVLAVVTGLAHDAPQVAGTAAGVTAAPSAVSQEDALAAAPMSSAGPAAAQPGPISAREPGVLELPRPTGPGAMGVSTGFPRTAEGALAQLAAIDAAAMQTGSTDDVRQVIAVWAAPGGPTPRTWSGVAAMARLLSAAGLTGAGSGSLAIAADPVMGLIKGIVGPDFAVVCVDFQLTVTVAQTSRIAAADCQRMVWSGQRWLIGPGKEPAPAPSIWPDTDAAIDAGYRDLRYV